MIPPLFTFQNLDPYAVIGIPEGGTCTRADLAASASAIVAFGAAYPRVALAKSTSCEATMGALYPVCEFPEC